MEQEFRTTFIPKKPIVQATASSSGPTSKPVGIVFVVSLLIFIVSLAIGGGVYAYKNYLEKDIEDLSVSLDKVQKNLDPNAIKEFSVMDKRLRNSELLLNQHEVVFPVFKVLGATTLPTVRYTKMDVVFGDTGDLNVTLSGESDGYRSIALQSQALAQNADLKDTIFSNFVVTPKGRVSFDLSFTVPKSDLAFNKNITSEDMTSMQSTQEAPSVTSPEPVGSTVETPTQTGIVVQ